MLLQELPSGLRPREKILAMGPKALTDAELLALVLGTGLRGCSVLELAHQLLERFRGLSGLLSASQSELQTVRGLGGCAKRSQLSAIMELARRSVAEQLQQRQAFESPQAVAQYLQMQLAQSPREVFAGIFLDAQHRVIAIEELFRGTLTQTSVYPREVAKCALDHNAAAVILAHNHPSGLAEPSRADELLTRTLKAALAMIDVQLLDHFIVTASASMSFAERGLV